MKHIQRGSTKSRARHFKSWTAGIMLVALLLFTGANKPHDQKGAVLSLGEKKNITIIAGTEDGTDILVEGCTQTALKSGIETVVNAKDGKIILKGKITYLVCRGNQLTSLNVQGLTQLQGLGCIENQLTGIVNSSAVPKYPKYI